MEGVGVAGFIDVETTGLSSTRDEIIELSLILFTYDKSTGQILEIAEEYTGLREPSIPIPKEASRIHGITKRHVKGKELDHVRIEQMMDKADFLIAHNARFDRGFVCRMYEVANQKILHCSMDGIDWRSKGFSSKGLQKLLAAHGIDPGEAHRADTDVKAAITLLSQTDREGQYYFAQLIQGNGVKRRIARSQDEVAATKEEPAKKPKQNLSQKSKPKDLELNKKSVGCLSLFCLPVLIVALLFLTLT